MKKLLFIILNIVATLALHAEEKDIDSYIPINKVQNLNTFVVIISNENYKYEEAVPYALNDGSTFRLYCEKTLGIPEKNIKYVPDASLNDMKYFLSWLERVMKAYEGSARAIFYYSGHGMPDVANRQAFLLPVDGHSISPESGLSTETLYARLGALQSASTMVLLDACFSGACRDGGMMQSARSVVIAPKKDAVSGNMVVFSAAKGNETAYPYRDKKHGMFTYFFLEKLNEMGGCVNLGELSDYVRAKVSQMSVIENEKSQTPTVLASTGNTSWRTWKFAEKPATTYENIPRNMVKPQDEESGSLSVNTSGATKNTSRKNRLALADGKITVNGVTYEMVRIDKGTFSMGSSAKLNSRSTFSMDMPRHSVTLNAYAIGKTEVPQAIWEAIMHDNPSENKGSRLPVENVTWEQCQIFIQRLNLQLGTQFRLSTEAEWEYAADCCNSMNSESFSGSRRLEGIAHTGRSTIECGSLKPSSIGIHDMTGNVAEWCQDYISRYSSSPQSNPSGPWKGFQRVVRGGSYKDGPILLRNCHRSHKRQDESAPYIGLRLAHDI